MIHTGEFHLIIEQGPFPGQKFQLLAHEIVIGRDPSADLVIPSPGVSREHARLSWHDGVYLLEDLGSSNGTFVNGNRLAAPHPLESGDRIQLGSIILLTFHSPQPSNPDETLLEQPQTIGADRLAQTVIGEEPGIPAPASPPQLVLALAGASPLTIPITKPLITIGRADDNDIRIDSPIVSRHHAILEQVDSSYRLTPLPEIRNPLQVEGNVINQPHRLRPGDKIRIGGQDPGLMVTLIFEAPEERVSREAAQTIRFGEKNQVSLGRDAGNDVVLDAPTISRYHTLIQKVGQRYRLSDLRSSNGTFVNDQRVEADTWLKPEDTIRIGPYRFVMGTDELAQYDETSGLRVEAVGLNKWVRKDLNILKDISLIFQPREFVVIVGQSGGGKSTLLDAISGFRPATDGHVYVNDTDIYRNFDSIRNEIGFVPQKDIIHMELTVYQALDYAARLRMPADTTKEERNQRVMEVLQDLDLVHRKDVQISGLSGGQQKRVSIGVELLTKPGLFFLDEPSSGLDPGTETALMHLLRRLADQGRTIVLITHATKNVMLADKVVFLARGGYVAWFGPPDEALEYFDQYRSEREQRAHSMEFDEIYALLDDKSKGSAEDWARRFLEHEAYRKNILLPLEARGRSVTASSQHAAPVGSGSSGAVKSTRPSRSNRVSSLRQLLILSSRNIKILTRDRTGLVLMLAAAPIIALLDVLIALMLGRDLYNFQTGDMSAVVTSTFMPTFYALIVGALSQMREFVKESDIFKRERLVNLRILPYVLSKIWVAAILAFYQAAVFTLIHYLAFDMPGGVNEFLLSFITLTLATLAGMMLGLFASALAPGANVAPLLVILLVVPQVVLGGALIPVPETVSAPSSSRWAFEALMSISGAGSDVARDACWQLPEDLRDEMTLEQKEACNCMGLNALRQESCDFPGLGAYYDSSVDDPEPVQPPDLEDPPAEPLIPDPPAEPKNQSDSVAVAEYLQSLQDYQVQVDQIRNDFKAEMEDYQAKADIYQNEMIAYQEDLAGWQINRNAAVGKAEGSINVFNEDLAWTFINKKDNQAYYAKLTFTWLMQVVIILVLAVAILLLIKRRDRA